MMMMRDEASCGCSIKYSLFIQQKYFLPSNLIASRHSHIGSLFTSDERKEFAHDTLGSSQLAGFTSDERKEVGS